MEILVLCRTRILLTMEMVIYGGWRWWQRVAEPDWYDGLTNGNTKVNSFGLFAINEMRFGGHGGSGQLGRHKL